jgi:transcriptional regulator with XRE-family HTH domain
LRALRTERNLSLDELARQAGLSRNLLGQIELGKTAPSVSVVWKIARVFDVPFSALLATAEPAQASVVLRRADAKRLVSPDGRFSSRALYIPGARTHVEFYELFLAAQSREDAQPHRAGTRENLIVARGRLDLDVADKHFELATGDAIVFAADVPHAYVNPSNDECWLYLVMTYTNRAG